MDPSRIDLRNIIGPAVVVCIPLALALAGRMNRIAGDALLAVSLVGGVWWLVTWNALQPLLVQHAAALHRDPVPWSVVIGLVLAVALMMVLKGNAPSTSARVPAANNPRPIPVEQIGRIELPPPDFEMREMTATTASSRATRLVQVERLNPGRVYPFLRFAYALENYAGSTDQTGNENRAIHPGSPPVNLHWDRYDTHPPARRPWFDFGIANYHVAEALGNAILSVRFLDAGLVVEAEGDWEENRANAEYIFRFQEPINAGFGLNGNGLLRVSFPRRDRSTIRLSITAAGLPEVVQILSVVLV